MTLYIWIRLASQYCYVAFLDPASEDLDAGELDRLAGLNAAQLSAVYGSTRLHRPAAELQAVVRVTQFGLTAFGLELVEYPCNVQRRNQGVQGDLRDCLAALVDDIQRDHSPPIGQRAEHEGDADLPPVSGPVAG